jgi:transposase
MRIRPKVKAPLPKIAEAIISIEITPWNNNKHSKAGRPPLSMYLVLESILFVLTEGCSWRAIDRPKARWNSVYQYFRRWCHRGTLQKVLAQYGAELAPGWFFVDSTHVKVHADGSNPAGGQAPQALGRTAHLVP